MARRLLLVVALSCQWILVAAASAQVGIWATLSVNLSNRTPEERIYITSPDSTKVVLVSNVHDLTVLDRGKELGVGEGAVLHPLAELLWAADSTAFAVTQSDGGNVGSWFVEVYLLTYTRAKRVNVAEQVKKDFMNRYKCIVPEDPKANEVPNVAALQWFQGSKTLLLVAEVPPHSSCPEMGKVMGYLVSVPSGRIIRRYEEKELKTRWRDLLGQRLKET